MLYNGLKNEVKCNLDEELSYHEEKLKRIIGKSKEIKSIKYNIIDLQKNVFKYFSFIKNKSEEITKLLESINIKEDVEGINLDKSITKKFVCKDNENQNGLKKLFCSNKKIKDRLEQDRKILISEIEKLENIEYKIINRRRKLVEMHDRYNNEFNDIMNCYPNDYDLFNKGQIKIAMEFLNDIKELTTKINMDMNL
ncbi:MAG: hypothetical protein N4A54_00700 [Peptostreptococcaceae bacterium]|nr:hypothetical protein [Peptostreptococcaceae bacterium]